MAGIRNDFLFLGLTRVTLFFGVSVEYFMLNIILSLSLFSYKIIGFFYIVFFSIFFHLFGYYISFNDPLLISVYFNKYSKFNFCRNKFFHKGNSYFI